MEFLRQGFTLPGSVSSSQFARKPATFIQKAIASGKPLLLISHNQILAAIVPLVRETEAANDLSSSSAQKQEVQP